MSWGNIYKKSSWIPGQAQNDAWKGDPRLREDDERNREDDKRNREDDKNGRQPLFLRLFVTRGIVVTNTGGVRSRVLPFFVS